MIWKKKWKILLIDKYVDVMKEILASEKEFTKTNYERYG